jgi:hypothetical protein
LVAVTEVAIAPDGRVVAVVVVEDPTGSPEGPVSSLPYFVEVDGRWRIDDVFDVTEAAE